MGIKKVEVEVEELTFNVAQGLGEFAIDVKKALDDGWQPGTDIPVILASAISKLAPKLVGVEGIGQAIKDYPAEAGNAVLQGLLPVLKTL